MSWDRHIGRRLKLRDLYILMAVVEAKGMGKAAGRLNMTQPAVSNAIADLEYAIATRVRADEDIITFPGVRGSTLDPRSVEGMTTKMGVNATARLDRLWKFERVAPGGKA